MGRALAHIEKVAWIRPIEGADNIELIGILGWQIISKKSEYHVGDLCCMFEIDSLLPKKDWCAFMETKKYKVKTMKLNKFEKEKGGVFSQGLAIPIADIPELQGKEWTVGDDVTELLGVTYYSVEDQKRKSNNPNPDAKYRSMAARHPKLAKKKWFRWMMKKNWGKKLLFFFFGKKKDNPKGFPEWIVKTDETRVENIPWILDSKEPWIKTEKCDGASCTYAVNRLKKDKYEFIVCSRNVRQADRNQACYHESNIYWELADKYSIEEILTSFAKEHNYDRVVLQGEGVGSVQGNPYKLEENRLYCFNLVINGERTSTLKLQEFCKNNGLECVPVIDIAYELPHDMESMKLEADGMSVINPQVKREGFVYRSQDGSQSFKNVSREYLLKHS